MLFTVLSTILIAVGAYFVGCINPAYLIGKAHGRDIRNEGSQNAGGTNALILFGKRVGFFCILFDIAKAACVVSAAKVITASSLGVAVAGTAVILGHMFPFHMKFKGGKGSACLTGFVLAYNVQIFLILLLVAAVIALATNYGCFAVIASSILFPLVFGVTSHSLICGCIVAVAGVAIILKHQVNLRRIQEGTEFQISYLWSNNPRIE